MPVKTLIPQTLLQQQHPSKEANEFTTWVGSEVRFMYQIKTMTKGTQIGNSELFSIAFTLINRVSK